jgi:transcriptional regulator with XRE-family HTH domain
MRQGLRARQQQPKPKHSNSPLFGKLKDADLTQRALAERLGVDPNTVNRWIGGELAVPKYADAYLDLLHSFQVARVGLQSLQDERDELRAELELMRQRERKVAELEYVIQSLTTKREQRRRA